MVTSAGTRREAARMRWMLVCAIVFLMINMLVPLPVHSRKPYQYTPTLAPITLQPDTPFAFGCAGPQDPTLLESFASWFVGVLAPTTLATLAWDDANGPGGWNGNASASVYIKHKTPALYYQDDSPLSAEQVAVLRRLDAAGIYNSFQIGEWGAGFHCVNPSEDPNADPGCGAWEHGTGGRNSCGPSQYYRSNMDGCGGQAQRNCSSLNCSSINADGSSACDIEPMALGRDPHNLSEAAAYVRQNYQQRQRLVEYGGTGGGSHSTPGFSYYSHEPARWGSKLVGFEVGENIENAQTHVAIARGSSRQWGVPWHMQLSPWHGNAETSVCADGSAICGGGPCGGRDAGHSRSFLRRMFIYHWLAGSALNTAECCSCYAFDDGHGKPWNVSASNWTRYPAHIAQPNGQMLVDLFRKLYATRDRGIVHAPLAIIIDAESGFGGSICAPKNRQQWGVFQHSENHQGIYDLLNEQLLSCEPDCQYPAIGANLSRGETMQLRDTPHGEFYDLLQSDVPAAVLELYPAVLLAGDITFAPQERRDVDLLASLSSAAKAPHSKLKKVLMRSYHADTMGHAGMARLQQAFGCGEDTNCSAVEMMKTWQNPKLKRPAAISDERLASLSAELNLVSVSATPYNVQWTTNTQQNGDVLVYIANNKGVAKPACAAMSLDTSRTTRVTVKPTKFAYTAVDEWLGDVEVSGGEVGEHAAVAVTLGPGSTALLHFKTKRP